MSRAKKPAAGPAADAAVEVPRGEKSNRDYTVGEEIANSVTHGIGIAFSIVALTLMVASAAVYGDSWALAGGIVFGISLILLYTGSTLYHAIPMPKARHVFKIMDHSAIYLLIAGSYTPFTLVTMRATGGWWMFAVVWTLAAVGISTEAFWAYRPRWLSAVVYLFMGWLAVFMIGPMSHSLAMPGLWLLVAGGLCYTLGTVFYVYKRVPYFHMVWHLWVLGGSVCHFLAVLLYVVPLSARL
ncbi:MAG TPA: hemolysin III family protein [Coriobacteriia bacterium]